MKHARGKRIYLTEIILKIFNRHMCTLPDLESPKLLSFDLLETHRRTHGFCLPRDAPLVRLAIPRLFSRSGALHHADLLFVENLLYAVSLENVYTSVHARER